MKRVHFLAMSVLLIVALGGGFYFFSYKQGLKTHYIKLPADSFFSNAVIKKLVLDNGLTVLLWQNVAAPKVFIQLTYGVGSAAEDAHERGIAHVIEHMIFNGTNKLKERDIATIARKFGARMNAETSWDFTWYYFETLKNNWMPFIDILADCMQNAKFSEQHLASEVKTVLQELRMVKDMSSRVMFERMFELAFPPNSPYHFCIAGYAEELSRLKSEDLKKFYPKYYRPDNAVLFMVGDFDLVEAEHTIQKCFGPIKKPSTVLNKRYIPLPIPSTLAQRTQYFEEIKSPQIGCFWLIPGLKDEHEAVSSALAFLLGNSIGGRLVQSLVNDARVAHRVQVQASKHLNGGLFVIRVWPSRSDYGVCYKLIEQELKKISADGFTAQELQAMLKNKERLFFEQTNTLGSFVRNWSKSYFSTGDETAFFHRPQKYASVTNQALMLFVKSYLDSFLMQRVEVLPVPKHKRQLSAHIKRSRVSAENELFKNRVRQVPLEKACYAQKLKNPEMPLVKVPRPDLVMALPNGIKVVLQARKTEPLVHITCRVRDEDYKGLSLEGVTVRLLLQSIFDDPAVKRNFYNRGVGCFVTPTGIEFSLLNSECERTLNEFSKMLTKPQLLPEVFERAQTQLLHRYDQLNRNPRALMQRFICNMIYAKSPYAWSFKDAIDHVKGVSFADIKGLCKRHCCANNMVLVLVGDFDVTRVKGCIEKDFAAFESGERQILTTDTFQNISTKNKDITMANNLVLQVLFEPAVVTMHESAFNALKLLDMVNFHGRGSRLSAVREEYGLFYAGLGGFAVGAERLHGFNYLGASFAQDMIEQGEALLRKGMRELRDKGITIDELLAAKQLLSKSIAEKFSTNAAIAQTFAHLASLDLDFDYYDKQLKRVREITLEDVNEVSKKYFNPDKMSRIRIGRI